MELYLSEELKQRSLPAKDQRRLQPDQVSSLVICRNHRRWLARSIDRLLTKAWDPVLTSDELQAVNDEINALVKKRRAWDERFVELGGILESGGAVDGASGYVYYGRAKALQDDHTAPEKPAPDNASQRHGHLYRQVDAEYYGYDRPLQYDIHPSIGAPARIPTPADIEAAILDARRSSLLASLGA